MNSFVVWETVKSATKQQQAKQMSTQRFWNKQHIHYVIAVICRLHNTIAVFACK